MSDEGTYLIVGGSAGLGRALAERFARARHALVLVSSDLRDTGALASDLTLRYRVPVVPVQSDLASAEVDFSAIDSALSRLPPLAGLLLPAGMNREDDRPGQAQETFDALTHANYTSPCKFIDHYLPKLRAGSGGLIVGFGSVAATRGRTRNAAYSAAKRALASYFESLRHASSGSNVVVQFYVLGYLDTNLAFAQRTLLPRATPLALAEKVYRRRQSDFGVSYHPRFWYPICKILGALPWFVYRRMSI
jgi:short-subunit dehydrogenase